MLEYRRVLCPPFLEIENMDGMIGDGVIIDDR